MRRDVLEVVTKAYIAEVWNEWSYNPSPLYTITACTATSLFLYTN